MRLNWLAKNSLSSLALVISLAALQSPLMRTANAIRSVSVEAGSSVTIDYERDIERAGIMDSKLAKPLITGPRQLKIEALAPGKTTLVICTASGYQSQYELVVEPAATAQLR